MKNAKLSRLEGKNNNENCHLGGWLAGVSRLLGCLIKKGTRILFNERHAWKTLNQVQGDLMITTAGGFTQSSSLPSPRPSSPRSSSRSVGMRDIARGTASGGIGAALYPGLRPSGMTNAASGFTLIELLVVVLIIGILAAVALPQYQKAVEQSKSAQALTLLRAVYESGKRYYMDNGEWPAKLKDFDVEIPWTGNVDVSQMGFSRASNEDWTLENAFYPSTGVRGVQIIRISGPYKGAGFGMYLTHNTPIIPTNQLLCVERLTNGMTFGKNSGDYCRKIFRYKSKIACAWENFFQ